MKAALSSAEVIELIPVKYGSAVLGVAFLAGCGDLCLARLTTAFIHLSLRREAPGGKKLLDISGL